MKNTSLIESRVYATPGRRVVVLLCRQIYELQKQVNGCD
jgi:hypothetical protein